MVLWMSNLLTFLSFVVIFAFLERKSITNWWKQKKINKAVNATDGAIYHGCLKPKNPTKVTLFNGFCVWTDDCAPCGGYRVRSLVGPDWWCEKCGWSNDVGVYNVSQ